VLDFKGAKSRWVVTESYRCAWANLASFQSSFLDFINKNFQNKSLLNQALLAVFKIPGLERGFARLIERIN